MSRTDSLSPADTIARLLAYGDGAPDLGQKLDLFKTLMRFPAPVRDSVVMEILKTNERQYAGLQRAQELTQQFEAKVDELIGRLWHPAIFLSHVGPPANRTAYVLVGNLEKIVGIASEVDMNGLKMGKEVLLSPQQTAIVAVSTRPSPRALDLALVSETTNRNSIIIHRQEEEIELELADGLNIDDFKTGDRVRYSRSASIAYGKVDKSTKPRFQLAETPNVPLSEVGGLDENLAELLDLLSAALLSPDRAKAYDIGNRASLLLTGPPGCGKTLLLRAAITELSRLSGRTARIFVVQPGELQHWLVGSSEHAVRMLFQNMRDAVADGALVVLLLDEVESLARHRGHNQGFYADSLLNALLAEIDGLSGRDGIAICATTNRVDLLDSAMLQRLSDNQFKIRPPGMSAARAILHIHLREQLPYHPNGSMALDTRREAIETALALLYGPASRYAELLRIRLRDGTTRTVAMRDMVSGRLLAGMCLSARRAAWRRERRGGAPGVRVTDMETAVSKAVEKVAASVTVHNVRNQISDLPTDVEVMAVERVSNKVAQPHRYLNPVLA